VRLANDWNRVDADLLAANVVAVGLGDCAQRHLPDLRAAADDDNALAKHLEHAGHALDGIDDLQRLQLEDQRVFIVHAVQLPENRAAVAALQNVHRVDVAPVLHNDAGHLVQHTGPVEPAADDGERRGWGRGYGL